MWRSQVNDQNWRPCPHSGRIAGMNRGIAAISQAIFKRNAAGFLCGPDCMAEGEGFELEAFSGRERSGSPLPKS